MSEGIAVGERVMVGVKPEASWGAVLNPPPGATSVSNWSVGASVPSSGSTVRADPPIPEAVGAAPGTWRWVTVWFFRRSRPIKEKERQKERL